MMEKTLIEVEFELLGDFYNNSEKVIDALINVLDPHPDTAESVEVLFIRPLDGRGSIKFSRCPNQKETKAQ